MVYQLLKEDFLIQKRIMSYFPLICLFIWYLPGSHKFIKEYWTLSDSFCYFGKHIMSNIENEFTL